MEGRGSVPRDNVVSRCGHCLIMAFAVPSTTMATAIIQRRAERLVFIVVSNILPLGQSKFTLKVG